jgi:hypothetical protein
MTTLYQYCDKCKTERNFDTKTIECITCRNKRDDTETKIQ